MRGFCKTRRKLWGGNLLLILTVLSCLLNLTAWIPPVRAAATDTDEKKAAVRWLTAQVTEEQQPEAGLYNHLCNALAILRMEEIECNISLLTEPAQAMQAKNNDELAHLAWASNDAGLLQTMNQEQNADGGFGLQAGYTSDIYDTMLVLAADYYCEIMCTDETYTPACDKEAMINYLLSRQNADGGWGYHEQDISRPGLSAEIGLLLLAMNIDTEDTYTSLDSLCLENFTGDFSEESFSNQAWLAAYLFKRALMPDADSVEQSLLELPLGDGSIYESIPDTAEYILLLRTIEKYHALNITIHTLETEADSYVLEIGEETTIHLTTTIAYTGSQPAEGFVRYTLLEDTQEVLNQDIPFRFEQGKTEEQITGSIAYTAGQEKNYNLKTEVFVMDEEETSDSLAACQITLGVHETAETELVLQLEMEQDNARLTWTDINNEDERFSYRLYRKCSDGEWESHPTWDGEESIKVLNIYPAADAESFLTTWMEEPLETEGEPAGKGLFDIDTVYISDYNTAPDKYLKDDAGNYKYDVLMFGAYDFNGGKDLTYQSYLATDAFAETGRGILLSHDTLTLFLSHPNFARFAAKMGVKLRNSSQPNSTKVRVVNKGILTSYPWNLSGELTISYTHILDQFAGGNLGSTVWMEFVSNYATDPETGAKDNAYLFTKGSFAMTLTGHTVGIATEDERKILANTLFYLKQLSYTTKSMDYGLQDKTAPDKPELSEQTDDSMITLSAKDSGTDYQYYVEAIGTMTEKTSNVVNTTITSGLKGFAVFVNDSETSAKDLLTYDDDGVLTTELTMAENEKTEYSLEDYADGEPVYVHVFAVDMAGNISEEQIKEVTFKKVGKENLETPYALFASDGTVTINGNEISIAGDIYAEAAFIFQGSIFNLDGEIASAGSVSSAGWKINIPAQSENTAPIVLPDYTEDILADIAAESTTVDEIQTYNSQTITVPTICQKTSGAWCSDVKLLASLISEGNVSLNANTVTCGEENNIVLCSKTGDITLQATKVNGKGLIYAPNGTVTINVSEWNYSGTIIAKEIKIQAGCYTQTKAELSANQQGGHK